MSERPSNTRRALIVLGTDPERPKITIMVDDRAMGAVRAAFAMLAGGSAEVDFTEVCACDAPVAGFVCSSRPTDAEAKKHTPLEIFGAMRVCGCGGANGGIHGLKCLSSWIASGRAEASRSS